MTVYPGMSANMMVLALLALCLVMVVYGLWKVFRIVSASRMGTHDTMAIEMLAETLKKEPLADTGGSDDSMATPTLSSDALKDFYADVRPPEQRYLH